MSARPTGPEAGGGSARTFRNAWQRPNDPRESARNQPNRSAWRFNRAALPKPSAYFKDRGLRLKRKSEWGVTTCTVCGTPDSLLVRTSGAFTCMACRIKGGDLLALYRLETGAGFIEAAKALGAWEAVP